MTCSDINTSVLSSLMMVKTKTGVCASFLLCGAHYECILLPLLLVLC